MEQDRIEALEQKIQQCLELQEENKRQVERALAIQEIKNVIGRVMYYHSAHMDETIAEKFMAQKAPDVAHEDEHGRFIGLEAIQKMNAWYREFGGRLQLKNMREIWPEIEDDPKNEFIGQSVMHTLTTGVIEVAEDGQTAKGIWFSPGYLTRAVRGKLRAFWHTDRHTADFIKEDGEWKIWHMHVYNDFLCPYEKSWAENAVNPDQKAKLEWSEAKEAGGDAQKPNAPSTTTWKRYNPFRVDGLEPRPPEPYKTFNDTFSY